jgi:hypothetical protein
LQSCREVNMCKVMNARRDGARDEVIAKYRAWIMRQPALMAA